MSVFWRVVNGVMAIFFTLAAIVQHNDPDWFIWIPLYSVPAVISFTQCLCVRVTGHPNYERCLKACFVIYTMISLHLLAYYFSNGKGNLLETEEGREFLGCLIIMAWILTCVYYGTGFKEITIYERILVAFFSCLPLIIWAAHYYFDVQLC